MKQAHCWLSISLKMALVEQGAPPSMRGGYTCNLKRFKNMTGSARGSQRSDGGLRASTADA